MAAAWLYLRFTPPTHLKMHGSITRPQPPLGICNLRSCGEIFWASSSYVTFSFVSSRTTGCECRARTTRPRLATTSRAPTSSCRAGGGRRSRTTRTWTTPPETGRTGMERRRTYCGGVRLRKSYRWVEVVINTYPNVVLRTDLHQVYVESPIVHTFLV